MGPETMPNQTINTGHRLQQAPCIQAIHAAGKRRNHDAGTGQTTHACAPVRKAGAPLNNRGIPSSTDGTGIFGTFWFPSYLQALRTWYSNMWCAHVLLRMPAARDTTCRHTKSCRLSCPSTKLRDTRLMRVGCKNNNWARYSSTA